MKLYATVESLLKNEPNFVTDDGDLKKWVIISKAQNCDTELISLLLENPEIKTRFFIPVKDIMVFNQALFIEFMEQKNYLNDSFTAYKNKIGLTIDGKFLNQRNEVALVWPYKDCILEGGQSREEDKREEIFFNEILAQDEINQLLDPKVFTNAKTYSPLTPEGGIFEGFTRNEQGTITDNLIIKGNNLLALHSLKEEFAGKVKLIYIDPPYNTGSDSFGYNDNFNHSTWLTFMKNRLEVAKSLLSSSGIFLVQCSFHQFAYLKVLMNDIFEKHLCDFNIQVRHPDRALTGDKEYNDVVEYLLIYSNDIQRKMPFQEVLKTIDDYTLEVIINDDVVPEIIKCDNKLVEVYYPNQYKVNNINANENGLKKISIRGSIREKNSSGRFFVKHLEHLKGYPSETLFKVPDMGDDAVSYRYFYSAPDKKKNGGYFQGMPTSSNITKKQYSNFYNFEKEYNNVSKQGGVEFRNGKKPEELLKFIIELFTNTDDLVLDYHLGSGTTASVCHKLNRRYIGIEQMQNQIDLSLTRLNNVISGDSTGISKSVNWQGGGSFTYIELKKYNQTFLDKIVEAKDSKTLLEIWEEMKNKSFLNYNIAIQKQEEHIEDFKKLEFSAQQALLISLLDKNQLYVNLSSLEDKDFECTESELKVTKDFYQLKK
ncbi:adenine-specific DNA-methyltransferase [Flavobacterium tiangeerense]|uniref:site-specific DNA-methyltransferase (adenine-specific) n=1 Tax=Flavobacterium tiangeerense TaxID=459471 RepID=A0ABY3FM18_9FLAO|nr:site-specific DNA-methyltransferase [Flavobacterium tiangeerense]TWI02160.1 adenine-specific DNA-methyltransferase [Flavobacterium tiangeerense]